METSKDEEYVMYIIVNTSLKMGKGKIAAQVGHSVGHVIRILESFSKRPKYYRDWIRCFEPKIVLKATEEQMREISKNCSIGCNMGGKFENCHKKKLWCFQVIDLGRTQIPTGSFTVLTFRPMKRKEAPEIVTSLKLL